MSVSLRKGRRGGRRRAGWLVAATFALFACGEVPPPSGATDGRAAVSPDAPDAPVRDTEDAAFIDTGRRDAGAGDAGVGDAAPVAGGCRHAGGDGATARCLRPTRLPGYYVAQALAYFDTLDVDADPENVPDYGELVARWEWPPWLLLTGFGRDNLVDTALALRDLDPSTVPERDCRFFDEQPFARCHVVFEYEGGSCPIYEEFVFDDAGRMTFIEAWSDLPGLLPLAADDPWGEAPQVPRLSTRVPGLGSADGRIDIESAWMSDAAAADPDIADFAERAGDFWGSWADALVSAPKDFFARGCGW